MRDYRPDCAKPEYFPWEEAVLDCLLRVVYFVAGLVIGSLLP